MSDYLGYLQLHISDDGALDLFQTDTERRYYGKWHIDN
jgi:hypothetical protein